MRIDTVKSIGTFITSWLIIVGCFWFLYQALLNMNTAALSENSEGLIVGGFISILTMAAQFVFQSEIARSAANQANASTSIGANAGAMTPGMTATATPEGVTTVTSTPAGNGEDAPTPGPTVAG